MSIINAVIDRIQYIEIIGGEKPDSLPITNRERELIINEADALKLVPYRDNPEECESRDLMVEGVVLNVIG